MKNATTQSLLTIVILAMLSTPAEAALIRHTFSGTINHVVAGPPPAPWEGAGLGSTWELSYVFDTAVTDQNPTSEVGRYFIDNGSISMDGVELFAVFGEITVKDGLLGFDQYEVLLGGLPLGGGGILLNAPPGTLASDAIPVDLNLTAFVDRLFEFGGGPQFSFNGIVTSFTSEVVPAPGAFLLLVLNSCFPIRNRRRRNL